TLSSAASSTRSGPATRAVGPAVGEGAAAVRGATARAAVVTRAAVTRAGSEVMSTKGTNGRWGSGRRRVRGFDSRGGTAARRSPARGGGRAAGAPSRDLAAPRFRDVGRGEPRGARRRCAQSSAAFGRRNGGRD